MQREEQFMPWSTSYVCAPTIVAALTGGSTLNLGTGNTTLKIALFSNAVTPNPDTSPQKYGIAPWNTGECTGTNWPAGGVPVSLTALGLTAQPGGLINFTFVPVSVANTTISTAYYGAIIYDTAQSNAVVCAIYFGGSFYTTTATVAAFTPPASGVFNLACIPGA
jgi:hypothetical protein